MPSRYSSDHSKSDAALLAENLGIDYRTIAIEPAFAAYLDMLEPSFAGRPPGLTQENIQSRCRGQLLMALSNEFGWMVLTTGNKSEMAVGYFTIYGDSVGGYAVIKDVLKTEVYDLCRYVNERAGREVVPEGVITKPPSAELRPDQRDDESLPPYEVLDPILEAYVEDDRTAGEIVELGHDEAVVRRVTRLVDIAEYKRRQCPPGVRVTTKAFGARPADADHQRLPRVGRRHDALAPHHGDAGDRGEPDGHQCGGGQAVALVEARRRDGDRRSPHRRPGDHRADTATG